MSTIRILLRERAHKSQIWLDDVDISGHVRGFNITAEVGAISEITLTLSAPVELEGEVARVLLNRLDDPPAEATPWDGRGVLQDGSTPERMRG